ncbi:ComF family protein [bacterium]|nr:ComF family protein [bacterium]
MLSFFFPSPCLSCGELSKGVLCQNCFQKIKWISSPQCTLCGLPFEENVPNNHPCPACIRNKPHFDWSRSMALYHEPVSSLITSLKYENNFSPVSFLANQLIEHMSSYLGDADLLIPVPLHLKKLKARGYNQSLLIVEKVSHKTKIPFLRDSLKRVIDTAPQVGLGREERLQNMKGAFLFEDNPELLKDKKVVLIDDVTTTGATLQACAKALKDHAPREVGCVTVAFKL